MTMSCIDNLEFKFKRATLAVGFCEQEKIFKNTQKVFANEKFMKQSENNKGAENALTHVIFGSKVEPM